MSRLLFAAARGARIQSRWVDGTQWKTTVQFRFDDGMRYYRTHPDDAHLAYGPISTALREMAETCTHSSLWAGFLATSAANEYTMYFDSRQGEPDYPLYYLILAEFLADSGL